MPNKREESISLAELASTGHRGQRSAEPISELNSDVIDEEKGGMVCRTMNAAESPIVSGIKEEKIPACSVSKQAGVLID